MFVFECVGLQVLTITLYLTEIEFVLSSQKKSLLFYDKLIYWCENCIQIDCRAINIKCGPPLTGYGRHLPENRFVELFEIFGVMALPTILAIFLIPYLHYI